MDTMDKDIQELILKRLETIPEDARLLTNSGESLTKSELIKHVKELDETGRDYIELELFYIKEKVKGSCHV